MSALALVIPPGGAATSGAVPPGGPATVAKRAAPAAPKRLVCGALQANFCGDAHPLAVQSVQRKVLAPVAPGAADRARAKLVYAEADGAERSRLVELTEHHITAKRRVSAVDDEGNSIRILSAVDAILDVAAEHEGELQAAVGADLG